MLAGVGGKTIVEAKMNLSQAEFLSWAAYRRKRGPLNPMLRQESGFALLAQLICTAHGIKSQSGKKLAQSDFMPYAFDEPEATEDEIANLLQGLTKKKPK